MTYGLGFLSEEGERELTEGKPEYADLIIKEGKFWRLYLNENQHLFGRAYLWLKSRHVDLQPISNLTAEEVEELFCLIRQYEFAMRSNWGAALLNVQWWGNEIRAHRGHGHMHLVPRYDETVWFEGVGFPDPRFGKNYHPYKPRILQRGHLHEIKQAIRQKVP